MFNLGFGELLLLAAIGIVVIGPKNLPQFLKAVGKGIREFKKASNEIKYMVQEEVEKHSEHPQMKDLNSLKDEFNNLKGSMSRDQIFDYLEKQADEENEKREKAEKNDQTDKLA